MNYVPGETVLLDRALMGTFVKDLHDGFAVVRFGQDTRVVYLASLSREE